MPANINKTIGKSIARVDAAAKVTGEALYPGDINMPNQAYMKILFANRPHAIVKSIDTSRAEALTGVIAVLTAKDVPNNEYGLIMPDQPVLCGPGSNKPFADRVRFKGDQVALIVAESEQIATKGRDLIEVDVLFLKRKIEENGSITITWGNLSTHMTKLEEAKYIEVEKSIVNKKTRTVLKITDEGKKAYDEYRKTMLSLLEQSK